MSSCFRNTIDATEFRMIHSILNLGYSINGNSTNTTEKYTLKQFKAVKRQYSRSMANLFEKQVQHVGPVVSAWKYYAKAGALEQ